MIKNKSASLKSRFTTDSWTSWLKTYRLEGRSYLCIRENLMPARYSDSNELIELTDENLDRMIKFLIQIRESRAKKPV